MERMFQQSLYDLYFGLLSTFVIAIINAWTKQLTKALTSIILTLRCAMTERAAHCLHRTAEKYGHINQMHGYDKRIEASKLQFDWDTFSKTLHITSPDI